MIAVTFIRHCLSHSHVTARIKMSINWNNFGQHFLMLERIQNMHMGFPMFNTGAISVERTYFHANFTNVEEFLTSAPLGITTNKF